MNELQIFENTEFGSIRTLEIDGEPYFVGKDVAEVLGYAKPLNALATHIDEDDSLKQGLIDSMGRTQETIVINESGLYSLILSSKLPTAKKFKRWVTSEVLPAIRKTGEYKAKKSQPNPELAKMRAEAMLLNAQNQKAKILMQVWGAAEVEPQYQALGINNLYGETSLPRIALKEQATALFDLTTIAKHLGVMSKSGKPHAQAIGAIVEKLKPLDDDEWAMTPYSRNGHDDQSIQYTESVEKKVSDWLIENNYPTVISNKTKNFSVTYKNSERQ